MLEQSPFSSYYMCQPWWFTCHWRKYSQQLLDMPNRIFDVWFFCREGTVNVGTEPFWFPLRDIFICALGLNVTRAEHRAGKNTWRTHTLRSKAFVYKHSIFMNVKKRKKINKFRDGKCKKHCAHHDRGRGEKQRMRETEGQKGTVAVWNSQDPGYMKDRE